MCNVSPSVWKPGVRVGDECSAYLPAAVVSLSAGRHGCVRAYWLTVVPLVADSCLISEIAIANPWPSPGSTCGSSQTLATPQWRRWAACGVDWGVDKMDEMGMGKDRGFRPPGKSGTAGRQGIPSTRVREGECWRTFSDNAFSRFRRLVEIARILALKRSCFSSFW